MISQLGSTVYSNVGIPTGSASFLALIVKSDVSFFGSFGKWKNEDNSGEVIYNFPKFHLNSLISEIDGIVLCILI